MAPYPFQTPFGIIKIEVKIDEEVLQNIAVNRW